MNTVIAAAAISGMPRAQAGVAGGITSAGRQAGQSLGVSVTGAIFAAGLHGTIKDGFPAASHPAWLAIAVAGFVVLPFSVLIGRQASGGRGQPAPGLAERPAVGAGK